MNLTARAGVRASVENPWVYVDTNITGTLNLLELCKDFNVKKFVLASTSSIYGANETPLMEKYIGKKAIIGYQPAHPLRIQQMSLLRGQIYQRQENCYLGIPTLALKKVSKIQ